MYRQQVFSILAAPAHARAAAASFALFGTVFNHFGDNGQSCLTHLQVVHAPLVVMNAARLALQPGSLFGMLAFYLQELLSERCGLSLIEVVSRLGELALAGCFVLAFQYLACRHQVVVGMGPVNQLMIVSNMERCLFPNPSSTIPKDRCVLGQFPTSPPRLGPHQLAKHRQTAEMHTITDFTGVGRSLQLVTRRPPHCFHHHPADRSDVELLPAFLLAMHQRSSHHHPHAPVAHLSSTERLPPFRQRLGSLPLRLRRSKRFTPPLRLPPTARTRNGDPSHVAQNLLYGTMAPPSDHSTTHSPSTPLDSCTLSNVVVVVVYTTAHTNLRHRWTLAPLPQLKLLVQWETTCCGSRRRRNIPVPLRSTPTGSLCPAFSERYTATACHGADTSASLQVTALLGLQSHAPSAHAQTALTRSKPHPLSPSDLPFPPNLEPHQSMPRPAPTGQHASVLDPVSSLSSFLLPCLTSILSEPNASKLRQTRGNSFRKKTPNGTWFSRTWSVLAATASWTTRHPNHKPLVESYFFQDCEYLLTIPFRYLAFIIIKYLISMVS